MAAWSELEEINARNRTKVEVLQVRLAVCRALEKWEPQEAERALKVAFDLNLDLRMLALDHPGLDAIL